MEKIKEVIRNSNDSMSIENFISMYNVLKEINTKGKHKNTSFGVVLVWDISNNYKIIFRAEPEHAYGSSGLNDISSLLIFPHNMEDFLMVTSSNAKTSYDCEYTEIYSIKKQKIIQKIEDSNILDITFLLSWYNKNNDNYFIIQFDKYGFGIYNALKKEVYFKQGRYINNHEEKEFNNCFIYMKDNDAND